MNNYRAYLEGLLWLARRRQSSSLLVVKVGLEPEATVVNAATVLTHAFSTY
jgi:hypothetical protein